MAADAHVSTTEFWESRYREGRTRWDLGGPTPVFARLLDSAGAPPPGKIAVVGCGNGHDVLLFARHGFDAWGFDFAPSAIRNAAAAAERAGLADRAHFEQMDVFDLPARYPETFDYILERACFCAIDPQDRDRYVQMARDILKPGGKIIGHFFIGPHEGGPPFDATPEEIERRFSPLFEVERLDAPRQEGTLPGADMFATLRRKV
jgi:SAM-dependent methyltransferase